MSDELFTRCPGCKTIFRVTEPQLALRDGQVRCGHCRAVFNGRDELVALDAPPGEDAERDHDELAAGPPTVTLRSAHALDPAPPAATAQAAGFVPPSAVAPHRDVEESERLDEPPVEVEDYDNRFAWVRGKPRSRGWTIAGAIAIPLLLLALVVQAVVHYRDAIAAYYPAAKPTLASLCTILGCTVRPLRNVDALLIQSSDLQEDPAHKGLLVLSATLRNRGATPVAYPYLELTLTDTQDQVVVRRALAPADYAGGTVDIAAGIRANGEVPVRLFLDASATSQAGWRLYLFYP